MTVRGVERFGAAQRDEGLRVLGPGGPHLGPGDPPAAVDLNALGADTGQVGAGVRFGHADAEAALAGGDAGQVHVLLLLGTVAKQGRGDLSVGDPLRGDGGAHGEQFLGDDEALEVGSAAATELRGDRHPDPAAFGEASGEVLVPAGEPGVDPGYEPPGVDLLGEKRAYLGTQGVHLIGRHRGRWRESRTHGAS